MKQLIAIFILVHYSQVSFAASPAEGFFLGYSLGTKYAQESIDSTGPYEDILVSEKTNSEWQRVEVVVTKKTRTAGFVYGVSTFKHWREAKDFAEQISLLYESEYGGERHEIRELEELPPDALLMPPVEVYKKVFGKSYELTLWLFQSQDAEDPYVQIRYTYLMNSPKEEAWRKLRDAEDDSDRFSIDD